MARRLPPRTEVEAFRRQHQVELGVEETTYTSAGGTAHLRQYRWRCACGAMSEHKDDLERTRLAALAHADPFQNLYGEYAEAFKDEE